MLVSLSIAKFAKWLPQNLANFVIGTLGEATGIGNGIQGAFAVNAAAT